MTNIYLVRHAHTIYTPEELRRPLSAEGLKAVEGVTKALQGENIDIVISSPYLRAIQTVQGIANEIGSEIILDERFRERKVAEQPVEDHMTAMDKLWGDYSFSFEGGESNLDAQQRGVEAVKELLVRYPDKNVVVGTHGNTMVLIMNYFDKSYDYEFWKQLEMPDIYRLSFESEKIINIRRLFCE